MHRPRPSPSARASDEALRQRILAMTPEQRAQLALDLGYEARLIAEQMRAEGSLAGRQPSAPLAALGQQISH